jgi:alpha-ketoglutarate-dependent taurine dioxygenase
MPILFGNRQNPYLRVNLNAVASLPDDDEATTALAELVTALRRNAGEVVFRSGECWFIDNYRAAHGRPIFQPKYDGAGRWLRRLYITQSLRRSARLRTWPDGRALDPTLGTPQ